MSAATTVIQKASPNDLAVDVTVLDPNGKAHQLSEFWKRADMGLALVFVRHFGCPFCVEHVAELITHRTDFERAGIDIVVIGNGSPHQAGVFSHEMKAPFPILTDPTGDTYTAYGLGKATGSSMFDPRVVIGGVRAALKGHLPKRSQGDPRQLQGQFLIDRNGIIRHADRPKLMSDIPSPQALLESANRIWST